LPQLVAVRNGKRKSQEGLRLQGEFLRELGIESGSISFGSGAGGSLSDHVTPRATLKLLQGMGNRADAAVYKHALPVMGVDGTLSDAVGQDSPARGKVLAKTGTALVENSLDGSVLLVSKALAGYLTAASGRQLNVVLFLSMVPLPSAPAVMEQGKVLGKICEFLVQSV
jgi:serine-type D-Ala-D-Ala carboxypeptidase/endopeptidase (penicillin-binding protein 4)